MKKTFPNHQQPVKSHSCGPFCLQNIYEHFGMDIEVKDILKDIYASESDPTYTSQLGRNAHKNGLETVLLTSNAYLLSPDWADKPTQIVAEELKNWITCNPQHDWIRSALFILFYLQEGGNINVTNLTTKLLDTYLDDGYVLLCLVEESWLWGKRKIKGVAQYDNVRGNARGHFVVAYEKSGDEYMVSDPYPTHIKKREKLYSVHKDQLLTAVFLNSAEVLAVKKK